MTNTSPPPGAGPGEQQGPRTTRAEVLELGRLRRARDDRRIAGVAAGIARHLDIDPIIVRVTLVVLVFFGGSGLLLYGAMWLLVPEEGSPAQPLGLDDRNRNIALLGTAVLATLAAVGDFAGAFWFPWPLVIIGLLVVWFLNRKENSEQQPATYASAQPEQGYQHDYQAQSYQWQGYAPPRNPRKRGPILFWFTLALIATGVGTLGLIDVSGTAVPDAAYPALAMSLTGAMLLLGAFWGRAGGLIFIGLVSAVATVAATATANYDGHRATHVPTSSAEVRDSYDLGGGDLTVDLSRVRDVEGLDGDEIDIDAGFGELEVIVPDGMDVSVHATVGAGDISLFGEHDDGFDLSEDGFVDGGNDVPAMRINIDLGVGQVTVREQ